MTEPLIQADRRRWRPPPTATRPAPVPSDRLDRAILRALAYSDVFDAALTPAEIHRYLAAAASAEAVSAALEAADGIHRAEGYVTLAGREELVGLRRRRQERARKHWPQALRQARRLARLPFVRMVGLTGAMAAGNPTPGDDLDYFLVTHPDRLWLTRALAIAVVRTARLGGVEVCPNYLVSSRALEQADRNLFAARELYQMVPLYGRATYLALLEANPWARAALPNAAPHPAQGVLALTSAERALKRTGEGLLGGRLGDRLEAAERARKISKLGRQASAGSPAVVFTSDVCKGHFTDHGRKALRGYAQRLRSLGL